MNVELLNVSEDVHIETHGADEAKKKINHRRNAHWVKL